MKATAVTKKCAELIAVSNNDEQACWRYLRRYGVERPAKRKRRHYQWPEEALEIATSGGSPVSLCAKLKNLTGYNEQRCWAYLKRHGIARPHGKSKKAPATKLHKKRAAHKRTVLEWPPQAAEIARRQDDATKKCAELIAVSNHAQEACWRYLRRHGVERPAKRKRRHYQWPEEALKIGTSEGSPVSRCAKLKNLTGYKEQRCWAYLERHGIARPGAKSRTSFSETAFERLFDCVLNHGRQEASRRFNVTAKTIYNALYKRGLTSRVKDCFTLRDLQMCLCVRPSTILHWVEPGLLKTKVTIRNNGKPMHKFDHEEVVRFCREHMPVLLPRRWPEKRLEFIELIVCAPKHADQLDPGRKKGTSGLGKKRLPEQSREEKVFPITTKDEKKQGLVS